MLPSARPLPRSLLVPLTILAWFAVLLVVGWLLAHVTDALLILVLASLLAFAATPLVSRLERVMPRSLAVTVTFVAGVLLLAALITVVAYTAVGQISQLVHNLPTYSQKAQQLQPQILRLLSRFHVSQEQLNHVREQLVGYLQGIGSHAAGSVVSVATGIAGMVVDAILIFILGIYLTANHARIATWLRQQASDGQQRRYADMAITIVNRVVGGYVRGTLTMALFIGTLVGVGMGLMRVPYAVMLAVLAFFMEFIPIIGVFISGLACVLVALTQGWQLALIVIAYFAVIHVLEGDVVGPRVMGHALGVHPAVSMLALIAGGQVLGFWGALFGAPIAGLIQAIASAVWQEWHAPTTGRAAPAAALPATRLARDGSARLHGRAAPWGWRLRRRAAVSEQEGAGGRGQQGQAPAGDQGGGVGGGEEVAGQPQ
jgi:predicted PurR-regulated permease PerM